MLWLFLLSVGLLVELLRPCETVAKVMFVCECIIVFQLSVFLCVFIFISRFSNGVVSAVRLPAWFLLCSYGLSYDTRKNNKLWGVVEFWEGLF